MNSALEEMIHSSKPIWERTPDSKEYRQIDDRAYKTYEEMRTLLKDQPELLELYENSVNLFFDLQSVAEMYFFQSGFNLGLRMGVEAYSDSLE